MLMKCMIFFVFGLSFSMTYPSDNLWSFIIFFIWWNLLCAESDFMFTAMFYSPPFLCRHKIWFNSPVSCKNCFFDSLCFFLYSKAASTRLISSLFLPPPDPLLLVSSPVKIEIIFSTWWVPLRYLHIGPRNGDNLHWHLLHSRYKS